MKVGFSGLLLVVLATSLTAARAEPAPPVSTQGWEVSPTRQELQVGPGETRTFAVKVERDPAPATDQTPVRFTLSPGDWDISRTGEVQLSPHQTLADSACAWATFSPTEFSLPPGAAARVRISVSVPQKTPPGLYRLGVFFEEHSVVPPQRTGSRRLVMRYRLSTLVYVIVPELTRAFALGDVKMERAPGGEIVIHALLRNPGTAHLRPAHWIEVRDAQGQSIAATNPAPTMVLLPGRDLEVSLTLPASAVRGAALAVRYVVDAGEGLPIQAATVQLAGPPGG